VDDGHGRMREGRYGWVKVEPWRPHERRRDTHDA
jgi:hypothetical protein